MCMFYNKDDKPLRNIIRCFLQELKNESTYDSLCQLTECLPLVGIRSLFIFLVVLDAKFRYWTLQYENGAIKKPKPAKVSIFLKTLRNDIIPKWMSSEQNTCADLVRKCTILYIKC